MASSPSIPDPNQAAVAGLQADIANFPQEYMVNSAAQQGVPITINGQTYDFTGTGNAAQSAASTNAMDQAALDIQNKYGPGYIQQALANLQQSNPVGVAARNQLATNIISQSNQPVISPLATTEQNQVSSMLDTSGQLDQQAQQDVQQGVRGGQEARGIILGNAPANAEADAMVGASDALKAQQQGAAQSFLASGVSPQDVQYRQIQQSLSNLGAFVNNQTPEAQFGQLSGAQNGAAPNTAPNYTTPASLDQNAGAYGINFANQSYQTQQQQANPWLAGLSLATTGANAVQNILGPNAGTNFAQPSTAQLAQLSGGAGPVNSSYAGTQGNAGMAQIQAINQGDINGGTPGTL